MSEAADALLDLRNFVVKGTDGDIDSDSSAFYEPKRLLDEIDDILKNLRK